MTPIPFDELFGREVLKSERLRATILAAIFSLALTSFSLFAVFAPEMVQRVTRGRTPFAPMLGGFAVVIAYQLFARAVAARALARGTMPPPVTRYLNVLVETAIPTGVILMGASVIDRVYTLASPAPFLYFVLIALSGLRLDFKLSVLTGASAALQYGACAAWALSTVDVSAYEPLLVAAPQHLGKVLLLLLSGVVTGFIGSRVRAHLAASLSAVAEKQRVMDLFGQQVSPAVVDKLLSQPSGLESESRHVCIMFLDIRDFTTFSESRTAEQVVAYLNTLWGLMIDVVNGHGGIVNKFLGDGFMAIFGAPVSDGADCKNAVAAAKQILELVRENVAAGVLPATRIGIGLHAGVAVTGNVGGRQRKEYSVIGEVVNLASRIEGLNKTFQSQLLISQAVYDAVADAGAGARPLGPQHVKGRAESVNVYQLV